MLSIFGACEYSLTRHHNKYVMASITSKRSSELAELFWDYVGAARSVFDAKAQQYGMSWLAFRLPSLLDQLLIKIRRIRTIQEKGTQQVGDSIREEYWAIINYAVLALIRLHMAEGEEERMNNEPERVDSLYQQYVQEAFGTMERKNHDYGEAWRDMFDESLADIILAKLMRIRTMISQAQRRRDLTPSIHDNLIDIINYAIFALIKLDGHA